MATPYANIEAIEGSNFGDTFIGDFLNNRFRGGEGADTIDGGFGDDTADYAGSSAVNVDLARAVQQGGDAEGDVLINVEDVFGSNGNDDIRGDGNDNSLRGVDGDDRLMGRGGDDLLDGSAGSDTLSGGEGDDTILSGEDNDIAVGNTGNDVIDLGAGDDLSIWRNGDGSDTVDGGAGLDRQVIRLAEDAANQVSISANGDRTEFERTNLGTFTLDLDVEELEIDGGTGNDVINGAFAAVDMVIDAGAGDDTVTAGRGADDVSGGAGDDLLSGRGGADTLDGGAGDDDLFGSAGNDVLDGGAGRDNLNGGKGADRLIASEGFDIMSGAGGADTFVFDDAGLFEDGARVARVIDFQNGRDALDLSDLADQLIFIGDASFSGAAGEIRQVAVNRGTVLNFDLDGDGRTDGSIRLDGADTTLTLDDFLL